MARCASAAAALASCCVAKVMAAKRQQETDGGTDFLRHHLHRIVAIGCAFRDDNGFRVRCLGSADDGEAKLIADHRAKVAGMADWQILQKSFDRMK